MDEGELCQLERQLEYFYPFDNAEFVLEWQSIIKNMINDACTQCYDRMTDEAELEAQECEEYRNNINLIKEQCLDNCDKVVAQFKERLQEFTLVPDYLKIDDDDDDIDAILNEYQKLKKECLEQSVFIAYLKKELEEYEELESVLTHADTLIEQLKKLREFEVPDEIKQQLVSVINKDQGFVYKLNDLQL